MDLKKIKGIVFDCDGVLADTEGWHWQTWVETLKPLGINLSKEEYFNYAGKREDIIDEELLEKYKLNFEKGTLEKKKKALMKEWVETRQLQLLPYAKEAVGFFAQIAEKGKIKMAVCSGSIKEETLSKLKGIGLYSFFPVITGGDEVKHGKPAPDVYLLSSKKLELKPEECLAFEDSEYGLRSAKSAGLICFAIPSEFSIKQDFSQADKIFKSLKEVVEFYKENYF